MVGEGLMSAKQLQAAGLFGVQEVERRGVRMLEPAYGRRAIRALLRIGYVQDDAAMQRVLREAGVSKEAQSLFKKNKVVMRHLETDGSLEVVPNIPGISDDNLSDYADTEACFGIESRVVDDRQLKYKLNQILTDTTLVDKLCLSPRRLQLTRRLAVSDPSQAAASLTDYLKSNGFPNVTVTAGDYARSFGRMREVIRQFANTIVYKDAAATAVVTPDKLRMTFDGFELATPQWTVVGPIKYATEVQAIYQLAIHYGPDRLMFLLGLETVFLHINIFDEINQVYFDGALEGYSTLEGIVPHGSAMPSELTAEQKIRLREASTKVSSVTVNGLVTGTAIHVSDKHWIVNEHTLNHAVDAQLVPTVASQDVVDWRSVGNDVAMVKRQYGEPAQWLLRHADVGERVVLCFSVGNEVEYSEILRVQSLTNEYLMLSQSGVLRKGASGAAVIALKDSALLGIFSTIRGSSVCCSIFDSSIFSQVADLESILSGDYPGTPGVAVGNVTYDKMVRRGLQGFLSAIDEATVALYSTASDTQVGLIANIADKWQTTVDPNLAQLGLKGGMPLTFLSSSDRKYVVQTPPPLLKPLPNVRPVVPGERVFVFTKMGQEVAMSSVRIVLHVLTGTQGFTVEDFGDNEADMSGGLLIAERDAAVVGQYVCSEFDAYGESIAKCVSMVSSREDGKVDVTALVTDLQVAVDSSFENIGELSEMGVSVIGVLAKQIAYARGTGFRSTYAQAVSSLSYNYERIIELLGFRDSDWSLFSGYNRVDVAQAFVAMLYIADPGGFSGRMWPVIIEVSSNRTPIAAEFPFPRPSSTDTVSRSSVKVDDESDSVSRLSTLESKFEALMSRIDATKFDRG